MNDDFHYDILKRKLENIDAALPLRACVYTSEIKKQLERQDKFFFGTASVVSILILGLPYFGAVAKLFSVVLYFCLFASFYSYTVHRRPFDRLVKKAELELN